MALCANAVPTAQAAVCILLAELSIMAADAEVLIIGNGRIGRVLAQELRALGAKVCVASRNAVHTENTVPTGAYGENLNRYDAIVNTAPALVFGAVEMEKTREHCFYLDLASAPGGFDREAARKMGRVVHWELGLPGRYFPVSAGRIIQRTVQGVLAEKGVWE